MSDFSQTLAEQKELGYISLECYDCEEVVVEASNEDFEITPFRAEVFIRYVVVKHSRKTGHTKMTFNVTPVLRKELDVNIQINND
jgi:hypothetical protein